ncbi:MAG: peptidylprolyl isomerase [Proteobacteria bacterium]|nr:peptidylprolyl isomerase [Pseudomonadota bacterium]MDA1150402.1 peptidylprolyl isomerase [Pseudomonadota bacterium]
MINIEVTRRALPPSICNVLDKIKTMIAMLKKTSLMSVFCLLFMLGTGMSQANAALEIVAKVNGKAVTNYQVDQRAAFLRMVTNLEDTEENRSQIKQDATQMLIDEILKLDAAAALDPTLAQRSRETARKLVDENFAANGKTGSQSLREKGIDSSNIQQKFITDIVWGEVIRFKFQTKFAELDTIVDRVLASIEANAKQPQVKLSEIILLPEPNRQLDRTLFLANEIIKAVNNGANFNAIAKQYSASGTAANGGQLGWVILDQLPDDIQEQVKMTKIGAVSAPLQRDGLIVLIRNEGRRQDGVADPSQDIITLARAVYPLIKDASNADKLEAAAKLERDTASINSCDGLLALNQTYGSGIQGLIENINLGSLNRPLQALVNDLKAGVPSKPLSFTEGISVFMLCDRISPKITLPSRDEVLRVEFDKIFGSLAERYLLRLRRSAIIETNS